MGRRGGKGNEEFGNALLNNSASYKINQKFVCVCVCVCVGVCVSVIADSTNNRDTGH